jgi:ABC-type antimicrobial peptide transport system permease subunit
MPEREWSISVKLAATRKQVQDRKPILSALETEWKKIYPEEPWSYYFMEDALTWLYDQETKTAWLMNTAMLITIFISSIGLFGLALFAAGRRAKEIGIRKVLGASVAQLAALLSKDFVKLVLIAIVIASPLAWYFMNQWLQDFVYRVRISGWVFIGAGLGAIGIALIPVGFQAIRAALVNPVKSLRAE